LSASILLLINGYESYSDKSVNYSAIISNILLIWAMFLAIKQEEKEVVAKPQNP
jgi:hypothetical protein